MTIIRTILLAIIPILSYAQNLENKCLNYQTDFSWENDIYASSWSHYIMLKNDSIFEKNYPVRVISPIMGGHNLKNQSLFSIPVDDLQDTSFIPDERYPPYQYLKIRDSVFLVYYNHYHKSIKKNLEYILNSKDTVRGLLEKYNLSSASGSAGSGVSYYIKDTTLCIKNKKYKTHVIIEEYNSWEYTFCVRNQVYLHNKSFIPLKTITTYYNCYTKTKYPYYLTTYLAEISDKKLPFKEEDDLMIFKDSSQTWTENQITQLKNDLRVELDETRNKDTVINCFISHFNHRINYYDFRLNFHKSKSRFNSVYFYIHQVLDRCAE